MFHVIKYVVKKKYLYYVANIQTSGQVNSG